MHATAGRCMSLCPPFAGVGSAILYALVGVKRREAALSLCWVPMDLSLLQAACHTLPFFCPVPIECTLAGQAKLCTFT